MTVVALVLAGLLLLTTVVFAGVVRSVVRGGQRDRLQAAVERERLINQVCHLSGHPWSLPPQPDRPHRAPDTGVAYVVDAEQFDVDAVGV